MAKNSRAFVFSGEALNTLAQSGSEVAGKEAVIIQGKGSELGNDTVMKGRAKRKIIAQKLSLALIDIAKQKGDREMVKAFWNTYYCQSHIISHDNRTYGKYCKNRHCPLCCSIRKAVLINKYLPVLKQWEDAHFVTLTAKACPAKSLPKRLKDMIRGFKLITAKYRKGKHSSKLIGIRALECCYNPEKHTYNPHFHLLVPNRQTAEILIKEWLLLLTPKFAVRKAQHSRPLGKLEEDLIETFKYGAKIFTEPDKDRNMQANSNPTIYACALYNIYDAMKGIRLIERFGFNVPPKTTKSAPARIVVYYDEWFYIPKYADWLGMDNEQMLSNYCLPLDLADLLNDHIDKEAE